MIKSLDVKNFTIFSNIEFSFGRNLNIFVGDNDTGKSHFLKLVYSIISSTYELKEDLNISIYKKLLGVFRTNLDKLLSNKGNKCCEIDIKYEDSKFDLSFSFDNKQVTLIKTPLSFESQLPVFIPTRELLTMYPFISTNLLEGAWYDTCLLLGANECMKSKEIMTSIEKVLGGKVVFSSGNFYLNRNGLNTEINLISEGLCKFAMLARLIATGSLSNKGYLFWDEPEANLNPSLIKLMAELIIDLSMNGIQVFVTTHNLFFLRELYIIYSNMPNIDVRNFGLYLESNNLYVSSGNSLDDISVITMLDEEIKQSDRCLNCVK